ncbi:MAG: hypothetical protein LDLANPLL_02579 [Turneriella sp.]|nr:hypothetical protein [Turneriella sp.]
MKRKPLYLMLSASLGLLGHCASAASMTAENSIRPVMTGAGGYKAASQFDVAAFERDNPFPTMFNMATTTPGQRLNNQAIRHLKDCTLSSWRMYTIYGTGGGYDLNGSALDGEAAVTNAYPVIDKISFGSYIGFPIFVFFSKNYAEFEPAGIEDGNK